MSRPFVLVCGLFAAAFATPALAQTPAEPRIWTVLASAGLALTSGNTDTSSVNAAYDITYDPNARHVVKSNGLWIRGESADTLTSNRLSLDLREEFRLNGHMFLYGQNQYLRDEFKQIDYLLAPTGGVVYKAFDNEETTLSVDAGIGGVWEKNPNAAVRSSGALAVGQKLTQVLTTTTTLTQSFSGLWKTEDLEDAIFAFGIGIAAAMSARTQLKVELLDSFQNKPSLAVIEKNDLTVLMAIVYKM